jgi:hypothetical protein
MAANLGEGVTEVQHTLTEEPDLVGAVVFRDGTVRYLVPHEIEPEDTFIEPAGYTITPNRDVVPRWRKKT